MLESLSPIDVALIKKIGGNGSSYTLPIASETMLGGVQPVAKTDSMTQSVGVDAAGALWTAAASGGGSSGGGSNSWELINEITLTEQVHGVNIEKDSSGNSFELSDFRLVYLFKTTASGASMSALHTTINNVFFQNFGSAWGSDKSLVEEKYGSVLYNVGTVLCYAEANNSNASKTGAIVTSAQLMVPLPVKNIYVANAAASTDFASGWIKLYGRRA